jgi:hypothetical protein
MIVYHATQQRYSRDDVIRVRDGMNYFTTQIESEGRGWVEALLEAGRPSHCVKRTQAVFAFDDPAACRRFAEGEARQRGKAGAWRYYEVESVDPTRHPICLVDQIDRRGPGGANDVLVQEYWTPTREWRRYEYLASQMRVVREMPLASDSERAADLSRATYDRDIAVQL